MGDACDLTVIEVEPNDDCMTAMPVSLGDTVLASLSPNGDYDYYSLSLSADTTLEIETNGDPFGDTVVAIFDSDGNVLIGCDDDKVFFVDFYSEWSCCLPPGNYCVGVKEYDPLATINNYSVSFRNQGTCSADPDPTMNGCAIENTFGGCIPF